jgi:cellulose synthase/poly-beta-1,6-N-acetylglucosamine synthase-like glycosyltransferase
MRKGEELIIIILFLSGVNFLLEVLMMACFFRHCVFTLVVSRRAAKVPENFTDDRFQPYVSIPVPARDEERVIGLLLQRITELSYPHNKLQLIIIDDASSYKTRQIAEDFSRQYTFM